MTSRRLSQRIIVSAFAIALVGCIGPSGQQVPISATIGKVERFILREPYTAGIMGAEHYLPAGVYEPIERDEGGIYYRAPEPIQRRGLLGGVLPGPDSAVEGGVYIRDGHPFPWLVWLWVRKPDGNVRTASLPGSFSAAEGRSWQIEEYQPLAAEQLRP